jgi:Dna[CI] antecedent, DciA
MAELSMAEAMQLFLKKSKLKTGIQAVQIEEVWEKIMGKTVAKYTDKIQIFGSKLYVTTTIAPLKNELLYQKEKIIEMVNKELGEVVISEVVIK